MASSGTEKEKTKINWDRSEQIKPNTLAKVLYRGLTFMVSLLEKAMRGEKV